MELEIQQVVQQAMQFPTQVRAYLAEKLLESLDFEEDFPVSDAWMQEITQRCRDIDEGRVELIPAQDALAQLREKAAAA